MAMLDMMFDLGHVLYDYRITGNMHGYSITLHIIDPVSSSKESPGVSVEVLWHRLE